MITATETSNVLIVDDRLDNIEALVALLGEFNANFLQATSGNQALEIALERELALVLMDVQMPEMDGFETARLLRSRAVCPIIFITAINKDSFHILKGYASGGVDYLLKPIDPAVLRSKVSVFLSMHEHRKKLLQQNQQLKACQHELEEAVRLRSARLEDQTRELEDALKARTDLNDHLLVTMKERERAEAERRLMEVQLHQSQKLKSLGVLAGGIAHDFNNLLTPITIFSNVLSSRVNPDSDEYDRLQDIMNSAYRAKELVQQILVYGRETETEMQPVHIENHVAEALRFLQASLPSTVRITLTCRPNLPKILADPGQIHQVVMNLCINAGHAMPEGGDLALHLELVDDFEGRSSAGQTRSGTFVCMSVRDTGCGMDEQILERIWEPYFTTREHGAGTGLGLSTVIRIIEQHQGCVQVESRPGQGTTFRVYWPATDMERDEPGRNRPASILKGSERVMFVDDSKDVADAGTYLLESLGYQVTSFTDSHQALEAFRDKPQSFDLVITDYTMPGLTGTKLADEVRAVRKDIPIILCTGYNDHVSRNNSGHWGIAEFVMKPYDQLDLSHAVRKVLDAATPP